GGVPMGVRFDASCSTGSIQKYLWTFGDGATSEQVTGIQDHVFERAGIFTVLLEITDGKGNFDQETVTITVQSP
ncbi:MAG TPA: PKD domain-containing protein, partial [Candidatus Peribacterales bacterium]|nr:PKD domain-containing protein [Candidatus Peribacterales bacterium]